MVRTSVNRSTSVVKRVLIAFEESGTVRDAFTSSGFFAMSADLKPTSSQGHHYQGDVFDVIDDGWDMMIAFPPCTYLCKAQQWMCNHDPIRRALRDESLELVRRLFNCGIPQIAIENPPGYLTNHFRQPTQLVYPFQFGDPYRKEIALWLNGLPPLISTLINPVRKPISNHTNSRMSSAQRSEIRSSWKYYPGLAAALVNQWGGYK